MFPSVYVWVRHWGAWKLHPYTSDAYKSVLYHKDCPFGSIWNMFHTQKIFAVMMRLVTITVTTKLVEASQHHCSTNTMLAVPKFDINRMQHYVSLLLAVDSIGRAVSMKLY